ncbi:unnamed protein product [Pedinophyceae sp. YPF-701]|nr:unnamed protein product [Pedinophyceae sp. YPF-701]
MLLLRSAVTSILLLQSRSPAALGRSTGRSTSARAAGGDAAAMRYSLAPGCSFVVAQGDITKLDTGAPTAIVNAANERCLGGGGVDGAIHRAAGPDLKRACEQLPQVRPNVRCPTGEAVVTDAFNMAPRISKVIHTVGPVYSGAAASAPLLASSYRRSLQAANAHKLSVVAFPAISCGVYGYPLDEAADVSVATIKATIEELARSELHVEEVRMMMFDASAAGAWKQAAETHLGAPHEEL